MSIYYCPSYPQWNQTHFLRVTWPRPPSYHPGLLDSKPSSLKPITPVSASGSPWVIVIRQQEAGGIYCPPGLLRVVILSVLLKTSHVGFSAWVVMFLFFSLHYKTLYFGSEEKYVANISDFIFICWPSVPGKWQRCAWAITETDTWNQASFTIRFI